MEAVVGRESRDDSDEVGDEDNEDEAFGAGPSICRNAQVAMVTGNVTLTRTRGMSFFCIFFCFDDACSPTLSSIVGGPC